jgi:protein-L-isoaspartate(D-aspartate) O-methyltransferase
MGKDDRQEERSRMVREQIEDRGISDKALLTALLQVPRHLFVPSEFRHLAYTDQALPSLNGQTISQPFIVAKMTELLSLDKTLKVLEIGTGTGYQTAILAMLAGEVYTIEIVPELVELAKANLAAFNFKNIHYILGDGYEGYEQAAPFDAIIVTAAPPTLPDKLVKQLVVGGSMVIPVGTTFQTLYLYTKRKDGTLFRKEIFPVRFVPMTK